MSNFAIIGVGGYIASRHLKAISDNGGNLIAAYDINDAVGQLDQFFPNCEFFIEFENFYEYCFSIQDNLDLKVDYLVICSPNYMHYSHICLGLRLGCDVICEKPLVKTVSELKKLMVLEKETNKNVYTVLQLRYHEEIVNLKKEILHFPKKKYVVKLNYITSRGQWYLKSWKNDIRKSFGLTYNIGIHFFDMLNFLFGEQKKCDVFELNELKASGHLVYDKAEVDWFLSIDKSDLPEKYQSQTLKTFRSIEINGRKLEFSKGFTDLHTITYKKILSNNGFVIKDTMSTIKLLESFKNV